MDLELLRKAFSQGKWVRWGRMSGNARVRQTVLARLMKNDRFGTHLWPTSQVEGEYNARDKETVGPTRSSDPERIPTNPCPSSPCPKVSQFNSSLYDAGTS